MTRFVTRSVSSQTLAGATLTIGYVTANETLQTPPRFNWNPAHGSQATSLYFGLRLGADIRQAARQRRVQSKAVIYRPLRAEDALRLAIQRVRAVALPN